MRSRRSCAAICPATQLLLYRHLRRLTQEGRHSAGYLSLIGIRPKLSIASASISQSKVPDRWPRRGARPEDTDHHKSCRSRHRWELVLTCPVATNLEQE